MKFHNRIWAFLLICVMLCGFAAADTPAAEIKAIAPVGEVAAGNTVEVPVVLTKNDGFVCGSVEVTWNPAALTLTDIQFGILPDNGTAPVVGGTPGTHLICVGDDLATKNYTETGTLFTLRFTVLAGGSHNVDLQEQEESFLNDSWNVITAACEGTTVFAKGDAVLPTVPELPQKTAESLLKNAVLLPIDSYAVLNRGGVTAIYPGERSVTAYIKNSRTFVPIRFVAEKLGATVDWDNATRTVLIEKDGHKLTIPIGSTVCVLDGKEITADAPAELKENRTMVPLRLVAEGLNYQVQWDNENRVAIVASEPWDMSGAAEQKAVKDAISRIAMFGGFV